MTLETIFYLSQCVASLAVVGSLIYLALQVRYAERSQGTCPSTPSGTSLSVSFTSAWK